MHYLLLIIFANIYTLKCRNRNILDVYYMKWVHFIQLMWFINVHLIWKIRWILSLSYSHHLLWKYLQCYCFYTDIFDVELYIRKTIGKVCFSNLLKWGNLWISIFINHFLKYNHNRELWCYIYNSNTLYIKYL